MVYQVERALSTRCVAERFSDGQSEPVCHSCLFGLPLGKASPTSYSLGSLQDQYLMRTVWSV
jgi:hypothetical protein